MLSYQHIYHAGNHADVIKHLSLLAVLQKLQQKSKPFTVIDTHAGAGLYDLSDPKAQQNLEQHTGVGVLLKQATNAYTSPLLADYVAGVSRAFSKQQYHGSAALMHACMRDVDQGHFCELHPNVYPQLVESIAAKNTHTYRADAYKQLVALVPPIAKRGVVLIDPPYEQVHEYGACVDVLSKSLARWANGCYLLWYPLINAANSQKNDLSHYMVDQIKQLTQTHTINNIYQIEWLIDDKSASGMYGSGIIAINLPWGCAEHIEAACAEMLPLFKQSDAYPHASFNSVWLKAQE